MVKVRAFLTLIRLPNLLFILLAQWLCYFFILSPGRGLHHDDVVVVGLLTLSTFLIGAAGYMINDYFDIRIDTINKPYRVTVGKYFQKRTVIILHIVLNATALVLSLIAAREQWIGRRVLLQLISILLLLVYSSTFKRKLIVGNLVISILSALSLFVLFWYLPSGHLVSACVPTLCLYMLFAFLITLAREVVKDMEDIRGDQSEHCNTIPLQWGINRAKGVVNATVILLILVVCIFFYTTIQLSTTVWLYWIVTVVIPLFFTLYKLKRAVQSVQFHQVSSWLKWITLAGIASMCLL